MFSGIVGAIGTVVEIASSEGGRRLRVRSPDVVVDLSLGASVAVDGACLTAVAVHPDGFAVDIVPATLSRTIAGTYQVGTKVNLERSLRLGDHVDGHLVQGHVDGVGEVAEVRVEGESLLVELALPPEVEAATVPHGSIAVNGVSLTVSELLAPGRCRVALIPYTRAATTLGGLGPGDRVNLEADLIGKYVGSMLAARSAASHSSGGSVP